MQSRINTYKKEGSLAIKHMWYVILAFSFLDIIVSLAVTVKNSTAPEGYRGASFAAIWSMFLQIFFAVIGSREVFKGHTTPLSAGFLMGASAFLSELFFVLMCVFFTYGQVAGNVGGDSAAADKAMGSFCLFNFIMYAVFAIILSVHRDTFGVVGASEGGGASNQGNNNNALSAQSDYNEEDEQL